MTRPAYIFYPIFAAIIAIVIIPGAYARQTPQMPQTYSLHVVTSGESPWSIMADALPEVDTRLAIEWLYAANGMPGDYVLQPGDILNVPDPNGTLPEPLGPSYSSEEAAQKANAEVNRILGLEEKQEVIRREDKLSSRAPVEYDMIATAYSPYDDQNGLNSDGDPFHTATGTRPGPGTVAVNPDIIPYGSRLLIIGNGWREEGVALDTGGHMRKNPYQVDLYRETFAEAMRFGRQRVRVRVME